LSVDDSGSIRKVAQRILQAEKLRTSEATTRAEAVEKCRREMPDCIIVDWQMPDGDALAFMGQLRGLPGGDKVKILYMTSENDPVHVARALRSGADAHMMKPFDRETFLAPLAAAGLLAA
jgi:two-component system chemotaxis response regulator CheY